MPAASAAHATATSPLQYRTTLDIEEHAASLGGWQLRYDQLTPGRFSGSVCELRLDGMQLLRDRANQAMVKNGEAWQGAITFSMPLDPRNSGFHCAGRWIDQPSLLAAHGERLPELRAPANLDLLCIAVEHNLLTDALQSQQHGFDLHELPRCHRLPVAGSHGDLANLLHNVLAVQGTEDQVRLGQGAIRNGIRDQVLMHLLDILDDQQPLRLTPNARKRLVDRACEYALANRDAPPSIIELCNRVGASRRKLQYCFQETLGSNPLTYLRTLRLNAVHRHLLRDGANASIQDAAAHWGFWHLSRFASDYRQLFGERPSETMRRARVDSC